MMESCHSRGWFSNPFLLGITRFAVSGPSCCFLPEYALAKHLRAIPARFAWPLVAGLTDFDFDISYCW